MPNAFHQLYRQFTCVLLTLGFVSMANAADFYISSQADFDTHRQATFAPGDNIYFERGKVFEGMFAPTTVGAPSNVITITAFGDGPRPVINNNGVIHPHPTREGATVSAGVLLFNAEYVELSGLEVTNNNGGDQDDEVLMGIYVLAEDTGKYHNHIYIEDNYVHHVNGGVEGKWRGGIHLHGYSPTTGNTATYNDVRIVNNLVEHVGGVGIGTDVDDLANAHDFVGDNRPNAITNLYVAHNRIDSSGRNCIIARDSDYALYEYNTAANCGRHSHGNSIFNFRTLGLVFQYNEAYGNTGEADDIDRGGFDIDYNSRDTIVQYNYSHGNHWFLSIMKRPVANAIVRYNLSVNERYGGYHYGFESADDLTNVKIYNNTHYYRQGTPPAIIGPNLERTPMETVFNNNIFYSVSPGGTMGVNAENGVNVIYDTNAYFNITPPESEANALTADPLFVAAGVEPHDVDMENGRHVLEGYRLSKESPYRYAGLAIADSGGLDFWGKPIPDGPASIGASAHAGFKMNAGMNDAWWNPDTDGQGFFIAVLPVIGKVALAWFTYDTELPPEDAVANLGDPGNRWLTAQGQIDGNQSLMRIILTSGGIFDAYPPVVQRTEPRWSDGSLTLTFDSCNSGTVEYDIVPIGMQGIVPITRIAGDNIALCEQMSDL